MNEGVEIHTIGNFLEAIRPWISPAALVAIFGLVLRWQLGLRKLQIEADQVEVNAAQVDRANDADLRDHYADEVRQLRTRLDEQADRYRTMIQESDEKHEQCKRDRDALRDDARDLKDIVAGLIRIIAQASASQAISLSPQMSREVRAAAERVQMLFMPDDSEERPT